MRSKKTYYFGASFAVLLMAGLFIGNVNKSIGSSEENRIIDPSVISTYPTDGEVDVARNAVIEITFSESLDSAAIQNTTFKLMQGSQSVDGSLSFSGKDVTFTTPRSLQAETVYTAYISIDSSYPEQGIEGEDYDENRTNGKEWRFTTGGNIESVEKVDIGSAANFVILAQSASQSDSASDITGEQGYNPNSNGNRTDKTAYWVDNKDIEANRTDETRDMRARNEAAQPGDTTRSGNNSQNVNLNGAHRDMMAAYTNAESRTNADFVDFVLENTNGNQDRYRNSNSVIPGELNSRSTANPSEMHSRSTSNPSEMNSRSTRNPSERSSVEMSNADSNNAYRSGIVKDNNGAVGTIELEPGIYKWSESVEISTNIVLSGSAEDVWIFQIPEGLTVERDVEISLVGGALAEHVFWQVAGEVSIGESSHFEGIILSRDDIIMKNGATLNGRMLTQSDVTLDDNTIAEPQFLTAGPRIGKD